MSNLDLTKVLPRASLKTPFVLGIDGLSRSGKTTFVSKLEHYFKSLGYRTVTFHIDDYIEPRNRRYDTGHEEWFEYYFLQWDIEKLKEDLFEKVKEGVKPDQGASNGKSPLSDVVIIEGVFLQRKEWRGAFDRMLFLDCAKEVRFQRESEKTQKKIKKFEDRYWKAEEYYLKSVLPGDKADIVIES
ncbi:kinase [Guptibacillus sedimenti]|uniref:kinase n=1 Tax=Guptibacillus sedimenti TaxID=3025680 RepID=UPI00235FD964|nr:kinase [Pseudalkalibacillus sedimenti]